MKVYLVATGCYSDYGIDAVFLDEKLAETFAERLRRAGHTAEVDERIVLDEIPEWQPCWIWSCTVRNGEVLASTPAPHGPGPLVDGRQHTGYRSGDPCQHPCSRHFCIHARTHHGNQHLRRCPGARREGLS